MKSESTHLHAEIDAVARRMTDRPAPELRTRVLARLEDRPAARRPIWLGSGLAAAAAVVLLVAVGTSRLDRSRPDGLATPVPAVAAAAPAPRIAAPQTAKLENAAPKPRRRVAGAAVAPVQPADSVPADSTWQISPLEMPDAPAFSDIQPGSLEIRPLVTEPLTVLAIDDTDARQ